MGFVPEDTERVEDNRPPRMEPCLMINVRCTECGAVSPPLARVPEQCPDCGAPKDKLVRR